MAAEKKPVYFLPVYVIAQAGISLRRTCVAFCGAAVLKVLH